MPPAQAAEPITSSGRAPMRGTSAEAAPADTSTPAVSGKNATPARSDE
jgi:hypothetical protein